MKLLNESFIELRMFGLENDSIFQINEWYYSVTECYTENESLLWSCWMNVFLNKECLAWRMIRFFNWMYDTVVLQNVTWRMKVCCEVAEWMFSWVENVWPREWFNFSIEWMILCCYWIFGLKMFSSLMLQNVDHCYRMNTRMILISW